MVQQQMRSYRQMKPGNPAVVIAVIIGVAWMPFMASIASAQDQLHPLEIA